MGHKIEGRVYEIRSESGSSAVRIVDIPWAAGAKFSTKGNNTYIIRYRNEGSFVEVVEFDDLAVAMDHITRYQNYIDGLFRFDYNEGVIRIIQSDIDEYLIDKDDPVYPGRIGE